MTHNKKHILLVEDDQSIRNLYQKKLELSGYRVSAAHNGLDAVHILKEDMQMPDAILLDLMMPIMRGDEVIEALQKTDWGKRTKVVVLTNMGESEVPKSVKAPNVIDYIVKADMTPRQVADKIHSILSKK